MIGHYSFGTITVSNQKYNSDLKIINGQVYPDWWRKSGHSVDIDDVTDIIRAKPDFLVIGSGKFGLVKVSPQLKQHIEAIGIEVIVEPTSTAVQTFNRMYNDGVNVAAGFHLTC